ncbi:T7SS effector LXG polymorphic toxin, partial [Enterococcus rotai]|uniref:T7SS effector LXG polymorphic toxin n=1 Tax=Enterococcus rotai TaxID=118060 RepID=UPI0035C76569
MAMVKMVIGEVQTQTEQIKAFGKTYSQALDSVSSATQGILLTVGMSGEGMDAIKSYISSVYPALCKAAILHSEATVEANDQYLSDYTSQCGGEDLDSEELQEQINEADQLIQGFQSSKDSFAQAKRNLSEDNSKLMGMIFQAAINSMDAGITRNQAKKAKIEEKLRKFLAFSDNSTSYFDGLEGSESLLTKGMQALGVDGSGTIGAGSWNGKGFSVKDTSWMTDVNKNWNDRVGRRDKK